MPEGEIVYARVATIRFPPDMRAEVVRVARGLTSVLREQRDFNGLQVLTDPNAGEGIIISLWETEDAAKASEAGSSYIGQMSMMSSFLYGPLTPKTYEVDIRA
jgi:heme-degrading monooxygenase HmoA